MKLDILKAAIKDRKQTYYVLRKPVDNTYAYSLMGVVCDLFTQANPELAHWSGNDFIYTTDLNKSTKMSTRTSILLPKMVSEWIGIDFNKLLDVNIKYSALRPEEEITTKNALLATAIEKTGDKEPPALTRAKRARVYWESIRDQSYVGKESLHSLNDALQMTFAQQLSVLKDNS